MSASDAKIPFGSKNGVLVDVTSVESGLACDCICPSCGKKLQAKKGPKMAHHFAHDPSESHENCHAPFETAIHKMAKQILSKESVFVVPDLKITEALSDIEGFIHEEEDYVEKESKLSFHKVSEEQRLSDFQPDIIAYQNENQLLIEIAVTHFCDDEKIKKIRKKKLRAIEVDLSGVGYSITEDKLRALIIENVDNKKWISNPDAKKVKKDLKSKLKKKVIGINERIREERKQRRNDAYTSEANYIKQKKPYRPRVLPKPLPESIEYAPVGKKQYDPRWFLCEACRHLFSKPLKEAPYTLDMIPCPVCEYDVSTKYGRNVKAS